MSDEKRTSVWPWIVAMLIGLPVLHVLSFGPACWMASRSRVPHLSLIYVPVGWAGMNGPDWLRAAICRYAHVGMPQGSTVILPIDLSGTATGLTPTR
jgi:hypothetical protein